MKSLLFLSITTLILLVKAQHEHKPQIPQDWIYTMIVFGFIGSVLILCIIVFAAFKTYQTQRKLSYHTKQLTALIFALWICNAIACIMWALCRTDLFINLNPTKCTVIYITNYLFYMFAKYFLHITLIYRLYIAFHRSQFRLRKRTLRAFLLLISINFLIFSSLWMKTCIEKVTIGITVPDHRLNVCTLFNNDSNEDMSTFHKIWPALLGAQDCIIGIMTLLLFMFKTFKVSVNSFINLKDKGMELMIRKLFICGVFAICSTFIFYTFAIPFYGNLTFLLPLDALINSFCVLLMISYGKSIYGSVCCGFDRCLKRLLKHNANDDDDDIFPREMTTVDRVGTKTDFGTCESKQSQQHTATPDSMSDQDNRTIGVLK